MSTRVSAEADAPIHSMEAPASARRQFHEALVSW